MSLIKRMIPTISGIITGIFLWDFIADKKLMDLVLLIPLFIILFNFVWVFYSLIILKKGLKNLERDALTFTPFLALILFPLKYLANFEVNMQFKNIPSAILLIFSISTFLFLKIIYYKGDIKDFKNDKLIYSLIITYFLLFSLLSIMKHNAFFSTTYDLAIYDQSVWGFKNLQMTDSIMGFSIIGGHFQPILFIITFFYLIYSNPITLLIIQTVMIALGALPIYLLTKRVLKNRLVGISVSLAYFLYPSIQFSNLFDFHPLVLALPLILFAFYFLEKHNYKAFFISMIFAGLCNENVSLLLTPFGIYLFLSHKKRIFGIATALLGLIWFVANISVIIPYFFGSSYLMLQQNPDFGTTLGEVIKTVITNPLYIAKYILRLNKLSFLILLLTPIAFGIFAFISPEFLLLGVTEFMILFLRLPNSLSEIVYHHQISVVPFIIVATIYGIKRFKKITEKSGKIPTKNIMPAISILLVSTSLIANIVYGPFAILYNLKDFNQYSNYAKVGHKLVSMIPENASVAAPNWILPHLSQREKAYTLNHFLVEDPSSTFAHFKSGKKEYPEYILIDLSKALIDPKRSALNIKNHDLNKLFNDKNYGIIASENSWILLKLNMDYKEGICKIKPFLDKNRYPHLNITIQEKKLIEKC